MNENRGSEYVCDNINRGYETSSGLYANIFINQFIPLSNNNGFIEVSWAKYASLLLGTVLAVRRRRRRSRNDV